MATQTSTWRLAGAGAPEVLAQRGGLQLPQDPRLSRCQATQGKHQYAAIQSRLDFLKSDPRNLCLRERVQTRCRART